MRRGLCAVQKAYVTNVCFFRNCGFSNKVPHSGDITQNFNGTPLSLPIH